MKKILIILMLLLSFKVMAADYSAWAIPTTVELVSGGVMIHGDFGDPSKCGKPNYIFVSQQSSTYDAVLSMALSALHGQREMSFYSGKCTQVSFHWAGEVINENQSFQPVYVR